MARPLQLATFEIPGAADHLAGMAESQAEEMRLAAYEQGYTAGWDDAIAAQTDEIARLRADLGRNLLDMSLSYQDARRHVLGALEPLLDEMIAKVLPAIARQTLAPIILEELRPAAENMAGAPLIVRTAPGNCAAVERLVATQTGLPVQVVAEPTLGEGQAYLKLADSEVRVDLDGVIAAIAAAVGAFFRIEKDEDQ